MSLFANSLPFEPGTRMTHVWTKSRNEDQTINTFVTVHLLRIDDDQDCDLEATLMTRFLPFHTGGFSGFDPHGRPWIVVIQHAPLDETSHFAQIQEPFWVLQNSLERALQHNPSARVLVENRYTRDELLNIYEFDGLSTGGAFSWNTAELIYGLLAEMCEVPLSQLVKGYSNQCAFPKINHECEDNVFSDVFVRWKLREISSN